MENDTFSKILNSKFLLHANSTIPTITKIRNIPDRNPAPVIPNRNLLHKAAKEVPKEVPKDVVKEVPKEVLDHSPKEVVDHSPKEVPKKLSEEPLKELLKELLKEPLKELLKESLDKSNESDEETLEEKGGLQLDPKLELKIDPIVEPYVDLHIDKIGVVITTYGKNNIFAIQNIKCARKYLPEAKIFLYLNEVVYQTDILEVCKELHIETFIIDNQTENGGLTATWNSGIEQCMSNQCDIIILSNDDLFVNETIHHLIYETRQSMANNKLEYFGPITNNPGPNNEAQQYYLKNTKRLISSRGLNGFFMVFPAYVLNEVKFDETHYFDPAFPFGGNEDEWYARFVKKGGSSIVVPSTFVYHYKLRLWRKNEPVKSNICIYSVNTGKYDNVITHATKYDFLYFTDHIDNVYRCVELGMIPFLIEKSDNPHLQQRIIKTSPHLYLPPHYDISIYIDANVIPTMNILETTVNLLSSNRIDAIHVLHPERTTIKDEAEIVIEKKLEYSDRVKKVLDMHEQDQFKDDVGLTETALLVRKHNNMIAFNEEWTKCIKICIRDQISFNYLLWKHNVSSLFLNNINKAVYSKNKHPKRKTYQ